MSLCFILVSHPIWCYSLIKHIQNLCACTRVAQLFLWQVNEMMVVSCVLKQHFMEFYLSLEVSISNKKETVTARTPGWTIKCLSRHIQNWQRVTKDSLLRKTFYWVFLRVTTKSKMPFMVQDSHCTMKWMDRKNAGLCCYKQHIQKSWDLFQYLHHGQKKKWVH